MLNEDCVEVPADQSTRLFQVSDYMDLMECIAALIPEHGKTPPPGRDGV